MNHSLECSKVTEKGDEESIDRISSLPDELLVHILSSLSTLSAAQTSLLSTRWRYLFTFTSNLSFSDREYFRIHEGSGLDVALKTSFEDFVYGVLASHKISRIQKFSLILNSCKGEYECSHIREWISTAILKKVGHLHVNIYQHLFYGHATFVPECAFNSDTLVALEINYYGYILVVPELVFLPNLKTLELSGITFRNSSFTRFLVGCPQLKELNLILCSFYRQSGDLVHTFAAEAEALQNLRIYCCSGHVVIINAPNLVNLKYNQLTLNKLS